MRPLDDVHRAFGDEGEAPPRPLVCAAAAASVGARRAFQRQLDDAMPQALLRRELALQLLLPHDRCHGAVDAEHLVVARHDLARGAGLALVEQDEVLDDVEQPVLRQHAVEQHLGIHAALVRLVAAASIRRNAPTRW